MNNQSRKILVTCALPYANGSLHLGHIVEYIQGDIYVRFQKMRGNECYFICGSDAHGTPIMLAAEKDGITPEQLIHKINLEEQQDCKDFLVDFDYFYTTHSPENLALSSEIFKRLQQNGDIVEKTIEQAFDEEKQMFLPDRYVKGTCPRCKAENQYGDNCEVCGATYSPLDMIEPKSALSGSTPVIRQSEHLFFDISRYQAFLKAWTTSPHRLQPEIVNKLNEWLEHDLLPWDISRDKPYFGFEIPGHPEKYFYVWLDAPIGYMASFEKFCQETGKTNFNEFWSKESETELYHFVGKDVIYFHALFWPAMLQGSNFRTPTAVFTHGFLTVDGQKMSKSRGTFIKARDYLNELPPEYLRYYLAAKLNNKVEDIDLNFDDFVARVNADLVGKVVNIASRCAGFIHKFFGGLLADQLSNPILFGELSEQAKTVASEYDERNYAKAVRIMMEIADKANQYIDEKKPWALAKDETRLTEVHKICTLGLNLFRLLVIYLKPILPELAKKSETFLNCPPFSWDDSKTPLLNHAIQAFTPLMTRIDLERVKLLRGQ